MPSITYKPKRFTADSEAIIAKADEICTAYMAQGYTLTLRQLYYQFVARGLLANTEKNYDKLGSLVNDARLAGLIDWDAIEDRTRHLRKLADWASPKDIIEACFTQFRYDRWQHQPTRVEVWIEKDALVGVIEGICNRYRVPYFACRGYSSQSEQWRAGRRFLGYRQGGQDVLVLHLGDHDPSGIDMTRDNDDRLAIFASGEDGEDFELESGLRVKRIALNMNQVRQYNPPPNPAKLSDSRAASYIERFGNQSWELDALEPRGIADMEHPRALGRRAGVPCRRTGAAAGARVLVRIHPQQTPLRDAYR
jgi:hypothetical protein